MAIQNAEVAQTFSQLADLLEIQGANPFRIRAYRTAARTLIELSQNVADVIEAHGKLYEYPGIGKDLASKIEEIVQTGHLQAFDEAAEKTPKFLLDFLKIPTLGPKRVKILHEKLGIKSLEDLQRVAESNEILKVRGFGEKTRAEILEGIKKIQQEQKKHVLLFEAEEAANLLSRYLSKAPGLQKLEVAGSFRRRKEVVADLDILVTAKKSQPVMEHFLKFENIAKVISKGSTRSTVNLKSGLQVDLRVVDNNSYGAALLYFTGSKAHNIAVRARALKRGLKINEYGVFKGEKSIVSAKEEEIYELLKLPYIEPELRENRGEIEAAVKGQLPHLIQIKDLQGDLHMHTTASDGRNSLKEMALAAKKMGYAYIGITDHSRRVAVAHGLDKKQLLKQIDQIDELNAEIQGITILKSIEVDILEDGRLDLPDDVLEKLDYTVGAIHSYFQLPSQKQTDRILRAMDNPHFRIFAHPMGRLIGKREPYAMNVEKIMKAAKERSIILELNSQPERMDLSDTLCRMAKDLGVKIAISTDSHSVNQLNLMKYGVGQARRGWLEKKDVINTLPLAKLKKIFQSGYE
ncbi:DNA polymerase/3'-5' exonuclease PolX [Bdellovibrio sp. HCB-162]|uniref:DNA polymerase/3'-5' exonuclease PolX n=1 Tax=Bdellovibrio sp. HCB-162 TaxID=3394234 RepID=UPI0039BD7E20